jgi:micrococcal nuclease
MARIFLPLVGGTALAALAAGTLYLVGRGEDRPDLPDPANATVVQVVDGDTLVAWIGGDEENVRLIGIDTPESVARNRPVECYSAEASQRLAELLPPGTPVRLERDIEPRDRYDRLLAYVYRADDGLLVNRDQVVNGFAEASEYPPNTALSADFTAAQHQARAAATGLWGVCGHADVEIAPPPGPDP